MGNELFKFVVSSTGLPEDTVAPELCALLDRNGKDMETMSLDDLREVMAEYLQLVLLEAQSAYKMQA